MPAGHGVNTEGMREVTTIPDYDPVKAKDAAWRLAFKTNRALQNQLVLELLNRKSRRVGVRPPEAGDKNRDAALAETGRRRRLSLQLLEAASD